jgi:hypothetical protein
LWGPAIEARLDHDPDREMLWVQSPSAVLVRLGQAEARSYKLQVGFRQSLWVGGFGVYFAGRPGAPPQVFHFQLLDVRPLSPAGGPSSFTMNRSTGLVAVTPGGSSQVPTQGFANSRLPRPLGNEEHLLEIEVRPRGLVSVRWHGDPCREVVAAKANQWVKGADYRGEFGIYCRGCSVVVVTARFMPLE